MAKTLTNLYHDILNDTQTINRELIGTLGAVTRDMSLAQGAVDINGSGATIVRSLEVGKATAGDLVPEQEITTTNTDVMRSKEYKLEKARKIQFTWTGEEQSLLATGNFTMELQLRKQIMQAQRALANEMEAYISDKALVAGYLAAHKAGSVLFDPNNSGEDTAEVGRLMDDNGTSRMDRVMVIGTAEAKTLRTDGILRQVNTSGTDATLREGAILRDNGFEFFESAARPTLATSTAAGMTLANNQVAGDTDLELAAGNGAAIPAGTIITVGSYNYIVAEDLAAANAGEIIKIEQYEGLKEGATAGDAVAVLADAEKRVLCFTPDAIHFASRVPYRVNGSDKADSVIMVQDEKSGLAFAISQYQGSLQTTFRVEVVYGGAVVNGHNLIHLAG